MNTVDTAPRTLSQRTAIETQSTWCDCALRDLAANAFLAASLLTEPTCKIREYLMEILVVDALYPSDYRVVSLARKCLYTTGIVIAATISIPTGLGGIVLRWMAIQLQPLPYLQERIDVEAKPLPQNRRFSILSWNICCLGGGYPLSDGGLRPWPERIDRIAAAILSHPADVVCLQEVFDITAAQRLKTELAKAGHRNFFYQMGNRAIGPNSGLFVASKFKVDEAEFTPFPPETLIGRTKGCTKGVFSFALKHNTVPFARIFTTHLQHSEIPANPTPDERAGRAAQMAIIHNLACRGRPLPQGIVVGDLNMEPHELLSLPTSRRIPTTDRTVTWGGDAFCATMIKKPSSPPLRLDYTFGYSNIRPQHVSSIPFSTHFNGTEYRRDALSDHSPLLTTFQV